MCSVPLILLVAWSPAVQSDIVRCGGGSCHSATLRLCAAQQDEPPAEAAGAADTDADAVQMLREAFELLDDNELAAALRAMQRAVLRAPPARQGRLDEQCRVARGVPLPDLLAETRLREALLRGGFAIKFTTEYERPALSRLMERRCGELLEKQYQGRTLAQWAERPAEYRELHNDTREMVSDARLVAGMLGARVRWDARLTHDWRERQRIIKLRDALAKFVAHVTALRGYTDPPANQDNPAAAYARRLAAETQPATQPAAAASQPAP